MGRAHEGLITSHYVGNWSYSTLAGHLEADRTSRRGKGENKKESLYVSDSPTSTIFFILILFFDQKLKFGVCNNEFAVSPEV